MKRPMLVVTVLIVYLLHQDFWFWGTARPFLFGFLPVGITYHIGYMLLATLLMLVLVRHAWPEDDRE